MNPNLVKLFYTHLKVEEEDKIVSSLKGVDILEHIPKLIYRYAQWKGKSPHQLQEEWNL